MRKLISRKPPEGFLEWAAKELCGDLDTYGMLYEQEWVEDWGLEQLLDEYARPRKRRMVRVECSCCGYRDLYHYGKITGWKPGGYGFVLPESYAEVEGGTVYGDGENILCPQCGTPVLIRRRAAVKKNGDCFVTASSQAMSAAVVGEDRLLVLTAWVIQRRAGIGGGSYLAAIPAEAYVFSATECAQLMGWRNSYSGTAGYFIQYTQAWRQPKDWTERWGQEEHIFGLTPELVASSCLPHCKLDRYMDKPSWHSVRYPVAWLRLCQRHPNAESLLVHGLPDVLVELIAEQTDGSDWKKNRRGELELPEIRWSETRPSKMLGLTTVEVKLLFKAATALILFTSSVIAEIVRGGLNSVAHGQFEAGHSQGFNIVQIMVYIVLPQAYRNIIPTLLSQVITTIKDSSYLANVAVIELMARTRQLLSSAYAYNGTGQVNVSDVFVLFGVACVIYFVINFSLSCVVRSIQKRRAKQPVLVKE